MNIYLFIIILHLDLENKYTSFFAAHLIYVNRF